MLKYPACALHNFQKPGEGGGGTNEPESWYDGYHSYRSAQLQRDSTLHSFDLDNNHELPEQIIDVFSSRTYIWWAKNPLKVSSQQL